MSIPRYDENYDCFNTDPEILYAIEFLYGPFRWDENGETIENKAWNVWYDPSEEQIEQVEKLAWSVAKGKNVLCWGEQKIVRSQDSVAKELTEAKIVEPVDVTGTELDIEGISVFQFK